MGEANADFRRTPRIAANPALTQPTDEIKLLSEHRASADRLQFEILSKVATPTCREVLVLMPWDFGMRIRIESLGPYQSLWLLIAPLALIEPLKFVAVFVAGERHWSAGIGVLIVAYATSIAFTERLFRVVKPKLLKLEWFAFIWGSFVVVRNRAFNWS